MIKGISTVFIGVSVCIAFVAPAKALTRTWISATGVDQAGCGTITSPCRTLQFAHDQTSANGEIDVKDGAGYGSIVVNKSISIINDSVGIAGVLSATGGNAIEIRAGSSDTITLRGLTIEGANVGYNGIVLYSGGGLDLSDSTIQNFVTVGLADVSKGNGIYLQPAAGMTKIAVARTTTAHNGKNGFYYTGQSGKVSASISIENFTSSGNANIGIIIEGDSSGTTMATIRNSTAVQNGNYGFYFGSNVTAAVDQCSSSLNYDGFVSNSGSVTIGRSIGTNNTRYGLFNESGSITSFKDNRLSGNGSTATAGTIGTATFN